MSIFDSIVLGIVEGLTEFLPVSSTAHLVLIGDFLHIASTDFVKSFEIIIQLGAILSVVTLFWSKIYDRELIQKLVVAFVPTGVLGLIFYKVVKSYLGNPMIPIVSLFVGGIIIIAFERLYRHKNIQGSDTVTYKQAFYIGLFQSIAMIPGVSRSGATILGGMSLGISRKMITEFSFMLAVYTMIAATGLEMLKNYKSIISGGNFVLLGIGFVVAYISALFAVKGFIGFVKRYDFEVFGIYRILFAIVAYLVLF